MAELSASIFGGKQPDRKKCHKGVARSGRGEYIPTSRRQCRLGPPDRGALSAIKFAAGAFVPNLGGSDCFFPGYWTSWFRGEDARAAVWLFCWALRQLVGWRRFWCMYLWRLVWVSAWAGCWGYVCLEMAVRVSLLTTSLIGLAA